MAYLFYTLTFAFLVCATSPSLLPSKVSHSLQLTPLPVLYATRNLWKPHAPPIPYLTAPGPIPDSLYNLTASLSSTYNTVRYSYIRLPTSATFAEDAEAGLHSSNFNLAENIEAGDSRRGLDENTRQEVYRIMKSRKMGFDEARRVYMEERFGREGIGRDGRPLDRKAVMFS